MSCTHILTESLEKACVKNTTFNKVNCLYNCIQSVL